MDKLSTNSAAAAKQATLTANAVIRDVTTKYLNSINMNHIPDPDTIEYELLEMTNNEIDLANAVAGNSKKNQIDNLKSLHFTQIADILIKLHHVKNIICAMDSETKILGFYKEQDDNIHKHQKGLYITDETELRRLIRRYNHNIQQRTMDEVIAYLHEQADIVSRNSNANLIPVNNGIFDYNTKKLLSFSPKYIFLSKSHINYNPNARNPVIHNITDNTDWDVESWMNELSDDPEIVQVLWEIIGAAIRPFVSWGKCAFFYSTKGNNGKGTLCSLIRNLCGDGTCVSIQLSQMSKDFALTKLSTAMAIVTDENDVGEYLDKLSNFKTLITHDTITINRKYKDPIDFQFYGFMIQCINELPRIKDKTDSFYRRQLIIPFDKCFTGQERKYIKDDYLKRSDVLEYVLCKVLNTDYYELSEPKSCIAILDDYKEYNDPVRQFANEILPDCQWDLLPFGFLYDLYVSWSAKTNPGAPKLNKHNFTENIITLCPNYGFHCNDKRKQIKPSSYMSKPEPLIMQYNLTDWKNTTYKGNDIDLICTYNKTTPSAHRGIVRNTITTI